MAGIFKRPPAVTGKPAVPTPANASLPAFQQSINNIRSRLELLEAALNQAYVTANASSSQKAVESLQSQIAILSKQLEDLAAQLAAVLGAQQPPTYLEMQVSEDAEDGQAGPPGPPGPPGPSPWPPAVQDCGDCGGDEYNLVIQQVAGTAGPSGDFFLWDEFGQVLLTEDGNAILTE